MGESVLPPTGNSSGKLIPSDKMNYMETYNASEGFFGIQDELDRDDMLLMLDLGVFYEFIPMDRFHDENSSCHHGR